MDKEKLWLRNLSCGHSRRTDLAFIAGDYEKPIVGDDCFCRECCRDTTIVSVSEVTDKKEIVELLKWAREVLG